MTTDLEKILEQYDYDLPRSYIAQAPASPRDSAKLLVSTKKDTEARIDTFAHLPEYIPKDAVLVFNETKVVPARLFVHKETGGLVEMLYLSHNNEDMHVLANRQLKEGARLVSSADPTIGFTVLQKKKKGYMIRPTFPMENVYTVFEKYGSTPIPSYIKYSPLSEDALRKEYQTVFAREAGSSAAPTASLHFTDELIDRLEKAGIGIAYVTLHVGLGTFAPLTEDHLANNRLHSESYTITDETAAYLNDAKRAGRPIIAVGTTVVRTLESATDENGTLHAADKASTDLFINEGYAFKYIDGMITNFHIPRSSLLMLVAAFIGRERLLSLYDLAKKNDFRFFSFGDGMLLF
jgi:S-adenosylmethionine:tRNA ribosyltransferase-isomerase